MATTSLVGLRKAFAYFVTAKELDKSGDRRLAAKELRKSDKIMDTLVTLYLKELHAERTKTA